MVKKRVEMLGFERLQPVIKGTVHASYFQIGELRSDHMHGHCRDIIST